MELNYSFYCFCKGVDFFLLNPFINNPLHRTQDQLQKNNQSLVCEEVPFKWIEQSWPTAIILQPRGQNSINAFNIAGLCPCILCLRHSLYAVG